MKIVGVIFSIFMILLIPFLLAHTQDSLYLIATITGENDGDQIGGVEWVGDVNGDGFDDVLINWIRGSWAYFSLYHDGAPFDTVAEVKLIQGRASGAGDVNADGYDDILVEKLKSPQEDPYDGRLYVYLGGPDTLTLSDFEFAYDYRFCPAGGGKVGGIGDVNDDGFGDFIFGSNYNWCDGLGRVFLFLGGDTFESKPKLTFMTDKLGDDFGISGAGADVNGDGYDDLIIGAQIGPGGMDYDTGKVMIYFGGSEMDAVADVIISDEIPGEHFGYSLAVLGDVNGDFFDDFLVGGNGSLEKAYLFIGGENISTEIERYEFAGEHDFGYSFSGLGDVNKDNFTDFMIFAGGNPLIGDPPQIAVNIYLGSATIDTIPDITFMDQRGNCSKLAGPGDINGDGYRDIIFGDVIYAKRGRVRIFSVQPISHVDRTCNDKKPDYYILHQNYPNPFNSSTTIGYQLLVPCHVNIEIFNSNGEEIKTLISANQAPGIYKIIWNAKNSQDKLAGSGIYFCKIKTKVISTERENMDILKLILLK